uniref:DDE_Tnp_1_7 domain-containing protein n=1 Tax=Strongyloides venezuelensis TaxID=75913 RepID=A0A0K0G5E2_STRVS
MTKSRFLCIYRFLVFENESDSDDQLEEVIFLSIHFNKVMEEQYYSSQGLCIDESMMSFKEKLLFCQFIKNINLGEIRKRLSVHWPIKIEKVECNNNTQRKRCILCANSNIRKDTSYYCGTCYNDLHCA